MKSTKADSIIRNAPQADLIAALSLQAARGEKHAAETSSQSGARGAMAKAKACRRAIAAIDCGRIMPDCGALVIEGIPAAA